MTLDSESNWEDVKSEQDWVTAKVVEEDESVEAESDEVQQIESVKVDEGLESVKAEPVQ